MVDTHSYKLSPFGPALQFVGGSNEISANSFWMRLALLDSELFFSLIVDVSRFVLARSRDGARSLVRASAPRSIDQSSIFLRRRVPSRRVPSRRVAHSRPTTDATRRDDGRQFKVHRRLNDRPNVHLVNRRVEFVLRTQRFLRTTKDRVVGSLLSLDSDIWYRRRFRTIGGTVYVLTTSTVALQP